MPHWLVFIFLFFLCFIRRNESRFWWWPWSNINMILHEHDNQRSIRAHASGNTCLQGTDFDTRQVLSIKLFNKDEYGHSCFMSVSIILPLHLLCFILQCKLSKDIQLYHRYLGIVIDLIVQWQMSLLCAANICGWWWWFFYNHQTEQGIKYWVFT